MHDRVFVIDDLSRGSFGNAPPERVLPVMQTRHAEEYHFQVLRAPSNQEPS